VEKGDTVKIKKSALMVGELVIDSRAPNNGKHGSGTGGGGGDGGGKRQDHRHFSVQGALEMEGVTLTGAYTGYTAGAVQIQGSTASPASGIFTRCIFKLNTAMYGGAVYIKYGSGTFATCSFVDNTATSVSTTAIIRLCFSSCHNILI
jgi:hypothetical protein